MTLFHWPGRKSCENCWFSFTLPATPTLCRKVYIRRPHGVTVRSEMPPTIGCQTIAITVPIDLRKLAATPSCAWPTKWMIMSGRIRAVRLFHRYPIATQ